MTGADLHMHIKVSVADVDVTSHMLLAPTWHYWAKRTGDILGVERAASAHLDVPYMHMTDVTRETGVNDSDEHALWETGRAFNSPSSQHWLMKTHPGWRH